MAATPIAAATRYINPETTKVLWLPAVANKNAPTRSEINAGTDLSGDVADNSGWVVTSNQSDAPDMGSRFTGKVAGRITADDSSLSMYASKDSIDARALMPRDTSAYVMWMDGGDVPGRKGDVFPVTVSSVGKPRSVGDEPARINFSYAITSAPAENVTIPA
ncbi:phage tail tube protein [Streptosporangium sp. NPDC004631]